MKLHEKNWWGSFFRVCVRPVWTSKESDILLPKNCHISPTHVVRGKVMFSHCLSVLWSQVLSLVSGSRSVLGVPPCACYWSRSKSVLGPALDKGVLGPAWGVPQPRTGVSLARTKGTTSQYTEPGRLCGAGGMPLAFTQDFLVFKMYVNINFTCKFHPWR